MFCKKIVNEGTVELDEGGNFESKCCCIEKPKDQCTNTELRGNADPLINIPVMMPMREWIHLAFGPVSSVHQVGGYSLNSIDFPSLSKDFLASALKIAHSLADQVCNSENDNLESKVSGSSGRDSKQLRLLSQGFDWSDRVVVHLSNPSEEIKPIENGSSILSSNETSDLEPLPFDSGKHDSDSKDLQTLLNVIIHDQSDLDQEDKKDDDQLDQNNDTWRQFQVSSAEFLHCNEIDIDSAIPDESTKIYSLGVVYYELFSGQKPPEIKGAVSPDDKSHDCLEPNKPRSTDFDSALHFFDDVEEDDEISDSFEKGNASGELHSKRKKAVRGGNSITMTGISTEPLRSQGLPCSLCDLIANMLDSANGDFRVDDSYSKLSDVKQDLELMMDKPNCFLFDLDIDRLTLTGLDLDGISFGRESEFDTLRSIYQRSILSNSEIAIISGPSGCGKSMLASRLAKSVTINGGVFLSGKFDQLPKAEPYSALTAALNQFCDKFLNQGGSLYANTLASMLNESLGDEIYSLMRVIPNLGRIFCNGVAASTNFGQQHCLEPHTKVKRLRYQLCRFVEIISSFSSAPVTLFLDDFQRADASTIDAVKHMLLTSGSSHTHMHFFFVCCVREDELREDHPFWEMVSDLRSFNIKATEINLGCMDKETTNSIVSNLLCLSPRLTRSLSDIVHHKTNGNPLFFKQLILSLNKEGLLRLSLIRKRWEWDEERIQSRKVPDDVAAFFIIMLGKLPREIQSALSVLSCFGNSIGVDVLSKLESELTLDLIKPLDVAVSEGLLDMENGIYRFVHDRIQNAAYQMMKPEDRTLNHFQYGIALSVDLDDSENDIPLFTAVGQINRGGPAAVSDPKQGTVVAKLNLLAGQRAVEMSDFKTAYWFFDFGISFLPKRHWTNEYKLSLELFEACAKCALALGEAVTLRLLCEQIMTYARTFDEKLNILYITMNALIYAYKLPEAVEKGIAVLEKLGERIPTSYSKRDMDAQIAQTRHMLFGMKDDDLLKPKPMTDHSKIMTMKFMARLQSLLYMTRPDFQPYIILRMVQMSLAYGACETSAIGWVYFGSLLGTLGNIEEGYRYGKIAKALLDKNGSKEVAGLVMVTLTHISCHVEPLQCAVESFLSGSKASMAAGDTSNSLLNHFFYVSSLYWMGVELQNANEKFAEARLLMEQHNHLVWLTYLLQLERTVSMLMGNGCTAEDLLETDSKEILLLQKNPHQAKLFYFHKMYVAFLFGKYEEAKLFAQKHFSCHTSYPAMLIGHSIHNFMSGIVSFWLFRESLDPVWYERGCQALSAIKLLSQSSNWNFENKTLLLEAEERFCTNKFQSAEILYEKAISSSREHKFIHEEALSCEMAGHFFREINKKEASIDYFTQAHKRYHEWGAVAKANILFEHVKELLAPTIVQSK